MHGAPCRSDVRRHHLEATSPTLPAPAAPGWRLRRRAPRRSWARSTMGCRRFRCRCRTLGPRKSRRGTRAAGRAGGGLEWTRWPHVWLAAAVRGCRHVRAGCYALLNAVAVVSIQAVPCMVQGQRDEHVDCSMLQGTYTLPTRPEQLRWVNECMTARFHDYNIIVIRAGGSRLGSSGATADVSSNTPAARLQCRDMRLLHACACMSSISVSRFDATLRSQVQV
jgi:hypothetical protein